MLIYSITTLGQEAIVVDSYSNNPHSYTAGGLTEKLIGNIVFFTKALDWF